MVFIGMKTNISEFNSYEELNDFFDNPIILKEIDLKKDETRKCEWSNMLRLVLKEHIKVNKIKSIEISYDETSGMNFNIIYSEIF